MIYGKSMRVKVGKKESLDPDEADQRPIQFLCKRQTMSTRKLMLPGSTRTSPDPVRTSGRQRRVEQPPEKPEEGSGEKKDATAPEVREYARS